MTVLTVAALLHLGLLALLVSIGPVPPLAATPLAAMTTIALTPDSATGPPPPPALPSKLAEPRRVVREIAFSDQPDAIGQGAAGGCATLPLIMKALGNDPVARAAVLNAPPEARSIADAVVIWNAGWAATASAGAPLAPARLIVEQSLRSIPDTCLDEPIAGPRLVPVPNGDRTMFVAIGSGNWTWRQLLEDPSSTAPIAQPQPMASAWPWFRP